MRRVLQPPSALERARESEACDHRATDTGASAPRPLPVEPAKPPAPSPFELDRQRKLGGSVTEEMERTPVTPPVVAPEAKAAPEVKVVVPEVKAAPEVKVVPR